MPWNTPSFPVRPRGEPAVRVVERARLTQVQKGRLRVVRRPDRWITGAVYNANGRLLPISQKIGGLGGHRMAMSDPMRIEPARWVPRLRGRWLYGGHWMMHFGHFLTETVTTLWPEDLGPLKGLVFHRYLSPNPVVHAWQQRMVDLAGFAGLPIHIVNDRQVRVDELIVPSRSIVQHGWGEPGAAAVWQRIVAAVPEQTPPWGAADWPSRVYMSRTSHNAAVRAKGRKDPRSSAERDALLDGVFAEAGFEIIAPEKLSIDDQVRLLAHTRVLAGQNGSALHLAGFAQPGAHVLELGDSRRATRGVLTQRVINTLCGHTEAFMPHGLDRAQLVEGLHDLGQWQPDAVAGELPG